MSRGPGSSRPIPQAQTHQGNPLDYIKSQLLTGLPEETILNRWNFTRVAGGALTRSGHNENDYGWPRAKRRTRRTKDAPPHNNRVSSDQGSTALQYQGLLRPVVPRPNGKGEGCGPTEIHNWKNERTTEHKNVRTPKLARTLAGVGKRVKVTGS